jgi:CheY-like chemotaxis protein
VVTTAADLLGQLEAEEAMPDLVALWLNFADDAPAHLAADRALAELGHRVTSREGATAYLEDIARRFYQGRRQPRVQPGEVDENGAALVTVWHWQPGVKRFTSERVPVATAGLLQAQRSARAAYWSTIEADRDDRGAAGETAVAARRRLLLAAIDMTIAPPAAGGAKPPGAGPRQLEEAAWIGDPAIVNTVLREALAANQLATAEVAARILGEIGSVEQLDGTAAVSPLAAAAAHGDPRVSATAIDSILRLAPKVSFVGASSVSRGLQYHLSALGLRRAVVVSPSRAEASRLVGLLAELGYEAEATTNGRIGAALAAQSVDCELVLIDFHSYDPSAWQTLAMIRRNLHTMPLPVAMVSTLEVIEPAEWLARNDRLTASWIRPHDAHGVEVQLAPLVARANRDRGGDASQRVTAAAELLERLLALPPESRRLFDLALLVDPLERALLHPELHVSAAKMLATLGRPAAQRALVDLASQSTAPMSLRQTAAEALAGSVGRFGVMLTNVQLLQQYDRYNDSEHRPRDEQQILSHVLDVLEAGRDPRRAAIE